MNINKAQKNFLWTIVVYIAAAFYFTVLPVFITKYARDNNWEGFGTVPFSENYQYFALAWIASHVAVILIVGIFIVWPIAHFFSLKTRNK